MGKMVNQASQTCARMSDGYIQLTCDGFKQPSVSLIGKKNGMSGHAMVQEMAVI